MAVGHVSHNFVVAVVVVAVVVKDVVGASLKKCLKLLPRSELNLGSVISTNVVGMTVRAQKRFS